AELFHRAKAAQCLPRSGCHNGQVPLPPVLRLAASRKPLHKEIRTPPWHPSIPRSLSARTRNAAVRRESASPKTVPATQAAINIHYRKVQSAAAGLPETKSKTTLVRRLSMRTNNQTTFLLP